MSPVQNCLIRGPRLASAILLCAVCHGCTAVPKPSSLALLTSEKTESAPAPSAATCTVELRMNARRTKTVDVPLAEDTRVQDVLDASRATSEFRNLDVVILRPTPEASEPILKLACRFDHRKRQIGWESDYAILPGDRVMVREDPSGGFDKVMSSVLGPVLGGR